MKGLIWVVGATMALAACGKKGGSKSGSGGGDVFDSRYYNSNFTCSGTSDQSRQYTLIAAVTRQPTQLQGDMRRIQASFYDSSSTLGSTSYGASTSQPAEAWYYRKDSRIVLRPSNANGYQSNWTGSLTILPLSNRGSFEGRLNGVDVHIHTMSCTQTNQLGANGTLNGMPTVLTCRDSAYTANINNGSMTLSRNGSNQETYSMISNGQSAVGSTQQTFTVQGQYGSANGTGNATLTATNYGGTTTSTTNQYTLRLSNVYYQNQAINSTLTCN